MGGIDIKGLTGEKFFYKDILCKFNFNCKWF